MSNGLDQTIADRVPPDAMLRGCPPPNGFRPEQVVQIAVEYVPTLAEPEQQQHALAVLNATTALYGDEFGRQDPASWEAMATFFADQGLLAQPVAASDAFTTEISV